MTKPIRVSCLLGTCALALSVGCSSKAGSASYDITDPGSGVANTDPLFPLHDGSLYATEPGSIGFVASVGAHLPIEDGNVVDGTALFNGANAVRYVDRRTGAVTYLTEGDDGWLELGTTEDGPYQHATLLVPKTAKVGMTWDTATADDHHFHYEVRSRDELDTPFGHKPVWVIRQADVELGTVVNRTYVEGRGLWKLDYDGATSGFENKKAFVVLSGGIPAPPASTPLAIEEIDVPDTTLAGLVQHLGGDLGVSLVQGPSGAPLLMAESVYTSAIGDVYSPICANVTSSRLVQGKYQEWELGFLTDPSICPTRTYISDAGVNHDLELNGHADGAMVTSAGIFWVPREGYGNPTPYAPSVSDRELPLALLDPGGGGSAYIAGHDTGYPDHLSLFNDGAETRIADRWATHTLSYARTVTMGPVASRRGVLLQTHEGAIRSSTASLTGVSGMRLEQGFAGPWSIGSTPAGTGVFRVLQDGTADRVVLGATGLSLQRAGEVQLPTGQHLIGLFEVTLDGAPSVIAMTRGLSGETHSLGADAYYGMHVYKVTTPLAATPLTRSPAFGVEVTDLRGLYSDVEVCWPPTPDKPVLTGWTLGGSPATAVVANSDGSCVIVMRDRSVAPPLDDEGAAQAPIGYEALEGSIPGVGPMAFSGPYSQGSSAAPPSESATWAPLTEGGFVGSGSLLDESGKDYDAPDGFFDGMKQDHPDAAGHGMWLEQVTDTTGTLPDALWLRNAKLTRIPLPSSSATKPRLTILGGIRGGGVAIQLDENTGSSVPEHHLVFPDGTSKALPATRFTFCGALPDGTQCVANTPVTCTSPQGTPTPLTVATDQYLDCMSMPWITLSDGAFIGLGGDQTGAMFTLRIDPKTGAVTPYDKRQYLAPTAAADGTVWALAFSVPGAFDAAPVQATPGGFVAVPVPETWKQLLYPEDQKATPYLTDFVVGSHVIVLHANVEYDRQFLTFRIPRP